MNWGDNRLPASFWTRVSPEPNSGCWFWIGTENGLGYGRVKVKRRYVYTHRMMVAADGRDPSGFDVDHLCRNTSCCNPAHLDVVTHRENQRRGIKGVLTTTCPKGHPYDADNTFVTRSGSRACRTCKRSHGRRRGARKSADRGLVKLPGKQRAVRPACIRGHLFDAANTHHNAEGHRICRACCRENARRYAARAAAVVA